MKDMPNLDLLRSIAVVLVVVEHTLLAMHVFYIGSWKIAWLGVVGVFMFFVHTSLVLMWSLERNPYVLGFYVRRIFRIYPLAIALLLLVVGLHVPSLKDPAGHTYFVMPTMRSLVENLLLVQNLHGGENIWGVMWSLPYEVDMYLLLPFLFFFVQRNRILWPLLLLWAATVDYTLITFHPHGDSFLTFLMTVPYFLAGVISYVLFSKVKPRVPWFGLPLAIAAILLCFMPRPSWTGGWLLTLTLGLLLPHFRQVQNRWIISSSHTVAKYSYGVYLVHPISIVLAVNVMQGFNPILRVLALLLSLVLMAFAAHKLVEGPMIRLGSKVAGRLESRASQPAVLV